MHDCSSQLPVRTRFVTASESKVLTDFSPAQRRPDAGYVPGPHILEISRLAVADLLLVMMAPEPDAVQKVNREMQTILDDPDIAKRLRGIGFSRMAQARPKHPANSFARNYEDWGRRRGNSACSRNKVDGTGPGQVLFDVTAVVNACGALGGDRR